MKRPCCSLLLASLTLVSCGLWPQSGSGSAAAPVTQTPPPSPASEPQILRLATTTSTQDSGLLDTILPAFEQKYGAQVEVVAVGTGQALEIGARGDADVVLAHARAKEDQFVADGDGLNRQDVMYNDFIIVGPLSDPAAVAGLTSAQAAFAQIAAAQAAFVSRGDDSGTYSKEKSIWAAAIITPTASPTGWYYSIGQGMGETLLFAHEKLAYTLTDRGTWLALQGKLPDLTELVGGGRLGENADKSLLNRYGVIQVNPDKHPGVNAELAARFVDWLTSVETQQLIADYGQDKYGQPLFFPESAAWKAAHP